MRNRSLESEREFTRLVGRSVDPWVVNFCLYFRWPGERKRKKKHVGGKKENKKKIHAFATPRLELWPFTLSQLIS